MKGLQKLEVYHLDYGKLEELVEQYYNFKHDYVADEETSNGEYKLYQDVNGKSFGIWEQEEFEVWLERKGEGEGFKAEALLNDMVKKEILPAGNYIISTCW